MELSENESESMSGEWSGGGGKCHLWRDFQYWSWMTESFIIHQVEKVDRAVPKERTTVKAFWVLARRFTCLKSNGVWVDIVGIEIGISKDKHAEKCYILVLCPVALTGFCKKGHHLHVSTLYWYIEHEIRKYNTWWIQGRVEIFKTLELGLL